MVEGGRVFRWLPDSVVSVHGDAASYVYSSDGPQRTLTEIDIQRSGAPVSRVAFRYEGRPDAIPDSRAGYVVSTAQRLAEVDTFVAGSPERAVRSVKLRYDDSSGLSRLQSVQTCSADGSVCLPAVALTVSQPSFAAAAPQSLTPPGVWLGDPDTALVDVDGDSLPDVVQLTSTGSTWWHNLGPAGFAAGQAVSANPGVNLSSAGAALQDMDGDGHAELFFQLGSAGEDGAIYAPFSLLGVVASLDPAVWLNGSQGLPPNGPDVRWIDLDGDGRVDALQAAPDGWTAWFNLGEGQLSAPVAVTPPEAGLSFEDPTLRIADMNGDGMPDLVRLQSGTARVFLNLGFGSFAPGQALDGAPDVGGDDLRLYLGDADGDGLADVFYVAPGRVSIWRNVGAWGAAGAQGFGPEIQVAGAPDYDPLTTTIRIADLLGHGVRGVVYSGAVDGTPFLWFLDPTSDTRSNLVTGVDNGVGGTRQIQYQSSGDLLATAAAQGSPFASLIPFPISTVKSLTQADGVSPDQQEQHDYRDPFYDPKERLFEGFASAETIALGDATAAGLETILSLHTGQNEDLCLAGKTAVAEARAPDGTLLRRLRTTWEARPLATSLTGEPVAFAADVEDDVEEWEGATAPPKTRRIRRRFDVHANVVEEDDDGWLGPATDPEAMSIRTSYAEDETAWILGNIAEREVLERGRASADLGRASLLRRQASRGLAPGQLTIGDEMRRAAWVSGDIFVDVRRFERDAFGNATAWLDADGRRTEVDYDATRHQFPAAGATLSSRRGSHRFHAQRRPRHRAAPLLRRTRRRHHPLRLGCNRPALDRRAANRPCWRSQREARLCAHDLGAVHHALASKPSGAGLRPHRDRPLRRAICGRRPMRRPPSSRASWRSRQRVVRDARGGVAQQFGAYFAAAASDPPPPGVGATADFRDPLGRLVRRVLPAGGELLWVPGPGLMDAYDALASEGQAEATRTFLDWRGQPSVVQLDPGGPQQRRFTFGRDAAGRVVARSSPLQSSSSAVYDGLGRLVTIDDPDFGTVSNQYDGAGHLVARVDARGQRLLWSYDQAGRVLSESDGQGPRAQYCYDDPIACGAGTAAAGRLLKVDDRSGTTAFGYDLDGRMVSQTVTQGGRSLATSFELDDADRIMRLSYPDGTSLDFGYGGRDLVTSIAGLLTQATYSAAGLPLTRHFANGTTIQLTRDVADRVVGVTATVNEASVAEALYVLHESGAPISRVDLNGTTSFQLDDAERLTQESGSIRHPAPGIRWRRSPRRSLGRSARRTACRGGGSAMDRGQAHTRFRSRPEDRSPTMPPGIGSRKVSST